jgi:predicted MFS family arabinose efflux permease
LPEPEPLSESQRARGRRIAIASHPFGMTFQVVFTQSLPTLALLALGASETLVGVQTALVHVALLLQLPTLRLVARTSKRSILLGAHLAAMLAALPLLAFRSLSEAGGDAGRGIALVCFAGIAVGISVSNTVWFPLLRSYVEPERIGRFFGTLRTGWHLTLIVYFLGSQLWLARHPGDFAPLFGVAWGMGLARIALISRLPERSERTGERIRAREALALAREPAMRRYLGGIAWARAAVFATLPFVVTLLRREVGFSEAQVVATAVATFAGGLTSLYLWGRAVDRLGAEPVFRWTALGMGALVLALVGVRGAGSGTLVAVVAFFFVHAVLWAGFGVADTHLLFRLTPSHAPSRALVLASVCGGSAAGLAPALAGVLLGASLAGAVDRLEVYRVFFVVMAALQALSFLPLRRFRGPSSALLEG